MTYRHLTDLADACRKSGLRVVELDGWQDRGRPSSTGGFDPSGVLCHHTGGDADTRAYAVWLATMGRSDLPPPLCQLALDRDGTVYVCAGGRANHAGKARASGPMPAGDGNVLYIGIEAMNNGSEGWTKVQRDAYVRLCAALCAHYGWPASHVRAHKETSVTGKVDPGRMDMDKFRDDVAEAIKGVDDVAAADVWAETIKQAGDRHAAVVLGQTWRMVQELTGQVAGLSAAVTALAGGTSDPAAIGAAVEAAVKRALEQSTVDVDVTVNGASQ